MSKSKQKNVAVAFNPAPTGSKKVPILSVAKLVANRLNIKIGNSTYTQLKVFGTMVPIEKVYINYERQRFPEPLHIKNLISKWNPYAVTSLECRYDPVEDRYYVCDGQQHGIAWCIQFYGEGEGKVKEIPANYFSSTDQDTESRVLLALNCDNMPMAKYFIHDQQVKMKDKDAVALELAVQNAGCSTGYKSRTPGVITHFPNLYSAREDYGLAELTTVLTNIRTHWPLEVVETDLMLGLLKVRELMHDDPNVNKNIFEDIFVEVCEEVSGYFADMKQAKLDIMDEAKLQFPDSYRGVNKRFPLAAGILDVYSKKKNRKSKHMPKAPIFDGLRMP